MKTRMLMATAAVVLSSTLGLVGLAPPAAGQTEAGGSPLTRVTAVTTGSSHGCAVVQGGQVRCWGENDSGSLGDGTTTPRTRAVTVRRPSGPGPLTGVRSVSAGEYHVCALLEVGQVACWGNNEAGQLGNGASTLQQLRPTIVRNGAGTGPLRRVVQVSSGALMTCARLVSGEVRCWVQTPSASWVTAPPPPTPTSPSPCSSRAAGPT
jgi:alpha-tubulin suppressor-like RCC1 family protein